MIVQHSPAVGVELSSVHCALSVVYSTSGPSGPSSEASSAPPPTNDPLTQAYDLSSRAGADHFLVSFQRSPLAWQVVDQLLSNPVPPAVDPSAAGAAAASWAPSPSSGPHARAFFAAMTLHSKIRDDMYQLPAASLPSLRASLLQHAGRYASAGGAEARPTVTRLLLATSALAVQMQWDGLVEDALSGDPGRPGGGLEPLGKLELFKLAPEEANSPRLYLQNEQDRFVFNQNLSQAAPQVLDFILHSATSSPSDQALQEQCLSCLQMWIRYIPIPSSVWVSHPIIFEHVFTRALPSPALFEAATDVLVEILRSYESEHRANAALVQKMIPAVMSLDPAFRAALAAEDEDSVRAYCRIFTEMAESYMSLLMDAQDLGQVELVRLVLRCAAVPEQDAACITMNFWYRFVDSLETLEPYEFRQMKIDYFQPQ
ncbi:hypothetical protein TeGR_g7551, partial [Tetraparma gracilis]